MFLILLQVSIFDHFLAKVTFERLCESKKILTVNQQFPGPTIYVGAGETLVMDVENKGSDNIKRYGATKIRIEL
ncbi:hypothetical protein H5410_023209 [Solanum commersonii]|uniref:Plastocyanin-like domain-containing protein n=1 Tax=Solanum commersonii TaxID=4109 RepID=A0A9J5ZIY9_SOLCO|nr:hypothetical protein H5410_023209 [Solanum commersonii]